MPFADLIGEVRHAWEIDGGRFDSQRGLRVRQAVGEGVDLRFKASVTNLSDPSAFSDLPGSSRCRSARLPHPLPT